MTMSGSEPMAMSGSEPMAMSGSERVVLAVMVLAVGLLAAPGTRAGQVAPAAPQAVTFLTTDSVRIVGRWYPGPPHASAVVLAPRRRGVEEALAEVAAGFQARGFSALTFALRDSAIADATKDPLRWVVLSSRWYDDAAAALLYARGRTDSTSYVFAWGQGLGAALALGGAVRDPKACDGIAVEQLIRFTEEAMRENGTAVIADAEALQHRMLQGADEPFSAATRLFAPAYAILTGVPAGEGGDATFEVLRRHRGRTDRWRRPWITTAGRTPSPADVDTLAAWYRQWTQFPRQP
jgi:hypothetical protein